MNEVVKETDVLTGNEDCSTSDIVERKKKSVISIFFAVHEEDKSKAICFTCNEKVPRGGSNPKNFNTTNFCKHLQSHSDEYKKFCKKEATKREKTQAAKLANAQPASTQASLKQITLQGLAERRQPFPSDHPCAKELTYCIAEMIAIDLQIPSHILPQAGRYVV